MDDFKKSSKTFIVRIQNLILGIQALSETFNQKIFLEE